MIFLFSFKLFLFGKFQLIVAYRWQGQGVFRLLNRRITWHYRWLHAASKRYV